MPEVARVRALAFSALLLSVACGVRPIRPQLAPVAEEMPGSLRLIGRFADGHACAITAELALSCAHMTDIRPFDRDIGLYPSRFSDGGTSDGIMKPELISSDCDLALYRGTFPVHYALAATAPAIG